MKFCTNCGAEVREGVKFCPSCGTPLKTDEAAASNPVHTPPAYQPVAPPPPVYQAPPQQQFNEPVYGTTQSNLFQRVINILIKPKEEWQVIYNEKPDKMKILFGYVLILALIPAIIAFLNFGIFSSYTSISYAIIQAVVSFVSSVISIFLSAFIIDALASSFNSEKNFDRSFQLVCYAYTPSWVAALLGIVPGLNIIAALVGFAFMVYLFITGLPIIKKTPSEKAVTYAIVSIIALIIIYFAIAAILGLIFIKTLYSSMMY